MVVVVVVVVVLVGSGSGSGSGSGGDVLFILVVPDHITGDQYLFLLTHLIVSYWCFTRLIYT